MKKRILSLVFVVLLLVMVFPFSVFAEKNVETTEETTTDLSKTTIEYDFENVFLGAYDVEDYKPSSMKSYKKQIIAFTEYVNSKGEIELYFYLYNPRQIEIYDRGENKISLSYSLGKVKFEDYNKYDIEKIDVEHFSINTSSYTNASLIKYKVSGFALSTTETLRAYSISEIELGLKYSAPSETVGKTFTFNENEDGLVDVITGGQSVIEIDEIGHTFYRVQSGTVGKCNDVRTVYFAVDKDIVNQNGLMDSVKVIWEEKALQPILLLDDETVLGAFQNILGQDIPSDFQYSFGAGMTPGAVTGTSLNIGHIGTKFDVGFNTTKFPSRFYAGTDFFYNGYLDNLVWSEHYHNLKSKNPFSNTLNKLYFAFYCDYLEDSVVAGEEILNAVDGFDGKYDGQYSSELFKSTDYYNVTYNIKDEITLNKYEVNTDVWKYIVNGWKFTTEEAGNVDICRFEKLHMYSYEKWAKKGEDYLHTKLTEKYLIDENDVDEFCDFVEKNAEDNYIYFIRYSVTDTYIEEAAVFGDTYLSFDTGIKFIDTVLNEIVPLDECYSCNGTLVDTVMVNDFDIIQLGFDDMKGGYVVVPVKATPTDNIPDISQVEKRLPPEPKENWWDKLLEILKKIAIVIITVISVVIVSIVVLIVLLVVRIIKKRKRGRNDEKKNN